MRYWIFDGQNAQGPYEAEELYGVAGFGPETLICPEDSQSAEQWKPARFYLIKPPGAKTRAEDLPAAKISGDAQAPPAAIEAQETAQSPQARPSPATPGPSRNGPQAIFYRSLPALAAAFRLSPAVLGALAIAALASGLGYYRLRRNPASPAQAPLSGAQAPSREPETPQAAPGAPSPAVIFVKDFPVQSQGIKSPVSPHEIFSPKKWRSPATIGEALEMKTLQALALWAADTLHRQGHGLAQGEKELSANQKRWEEHARRFLATHIRLDWVAEPKAPEPGPEGGPQNGLYRVTARLRIAKSPVAEKLVFEADLKAGTLKPVSVDAWFILDPKKCAEWGGRYLMLGEPLNEAAVVLPSPSYGLGKPKPAPVKPRPAKPQPLPGEQDYDVISEEPLKAPATRTSLRALLPPPSPAAEKPARPATPAPAPAPAPAPEAASKGRNATDMSVNELERYLKRPAQPAPEPAEGAQGLEP